MAEHRKSNYFTVLETQKRRLGDYEQVHFRKSIVDRVRLASSVSSEIVLSPKRPPKPQLVPFDKTNAALYLRQTENLWLSPAMTRQDATKTLFNKPTGSFIVRNSQKARYALTVRLATSDPAVSHFLIQTNQQGFLTIQGSNLPFLSIYDLLAYFCFNQSGGMPCLLHAPKPSEARATETTEYSDSSESDDEAERSKPPPPVPPRSTGMPVSVTMAYSAAQGEELSGKKNMTVIDPYPTHEEIFIHRQTGLTEKKVLPVTRRKPPPKPPRNWNIEEESDLTQGQQDEIHRVVKRVSGIVDVDVNHLYRHMSRKPHLQKQEPVTRKRKMSRSAEVISPEALGALPRACASVSSAPSSPHRKKNSIASLIQKFEAKSASPSPPLRRSPPAPKKKVLHQTQSTDTAVRAPVPPPKPHFLPPPLPPRPLLSTGKHPPVIPPHTPAPLLPPKPPGSKSPIIPPRLRERSSSDATITIHSPEPEIMASPPIRPKRKYLYYEEVPSLPPTVAMPTNPPLEESQQSEFMELSESFASTSISQLPGSSKYDESSSGGGGGGGKSSGLKWKPPAWARKLQFHKKPRKRIKKFIIELATDQTQDFGKRINDFISDMRNRSSEPHQKMLSEVRNFVTSMHDLLLQNHRSGLTNCGMESCDNFEHVVETSLQQCILQPLSHYIYLRIEEYFTQNGFLFQVQRSIYQGKNKSPDEMGIRKNLVLPGEKVISEISVVFQRMMKTYCAISKLEYLLEAVRLTYENIRDPRHPKKPMTDIGADDFLPLFVWVLVQCSFHRAEIEAEYMWGLAHPSLFNGEAGYYLTTLTSAVNVLKEITQAPASPTPELQQLPAMNNLQTELKVFFEDENTGQYSSAYYLPIVPTMTAAEICEILAERHRKPNPEEYGLFAVINGQTVLLEDQERPQEIKLRWTLERSSRHATTQQQISNRFIAYKRKVL